MEISKKLEEMKEKIIPLVTENRMVQKAGEIKAGKPIKTVEEKIDRWVDFSKTSFNEAKINVQANVEEKTNEFKDSKYFKLMENKGLRLREYMINAIEKEKVQKVTKDSLDLTDYVNGNEKITNQIEEGTPKSEEIVEPTTEYTEVNPPREIYNSARESAKVVFNNMIEGIEKTKTSIKEGLHLDETTLERIIEIYSVAYMNGVKTARKKLQATTENLVEFKEQVKEFAEIVTKLFSEAYMKGINNARAKGEEFKEQAKDIVTNLPDDEIIKYAINEANEWLSDRINDRELINSIKESLEPYLRGLRNGSKKRFDNMIEIEEKIANRTNEEEKTSKVISFELGTANLEVSDNKSLLEKIYEIKRELKDTENANKEKEEEIAGKQGEADKNIKEAQAKQEEIIQLSAQKFKKYSEKLKKAKETSRSLKSRDEEVQRILDESEAQLEEANEIKTALKAA